MNILINSYACGPNWGSEVGMGWHWVTALANHCQLYVITELGFKDDIEKKLPELNLKFQPKFYYVDIGDTGRILFWKQGSFKFYKYYKAWQKNALLTANKIIKTETIDLIHQLNMIGFREPGYLWKIENKPYIIGPLGGFNMFPAAFFKLLNKKDFLFYFLRNIANYIQVNFQRRPHKAYKRAKIIILATSCKLDYFSKRFKNVKVYSETGASILKKNAIINKPNINEKLILGWVGLLKARKGLPIALKAISKSKNRDKILLKIVGSGPNIEYYKEMSKELDIEKSVEWFGKLPNNKTKEIISKSHFLLITSVLDSTTTIVFESLQSSTPVICHDALGFGDVVDSSCGFKFQMLDFDTSVNDLTIILDNMFDKKLDYVRLVNGAKARLSKYEWDYKAKLMFNDYKNAIYEKSS